MRIPLYVWDEKTKQVLIIKSEKHNAKDAYTIGTRKPTLDLNYSPDSAFRYGSYVFSGDSWVLGSWWTTSINSFPKEFRLALVLMGVDHARQ